MQNVIIKSDNKFILYVILFLLGSGLCLWGAYHAFNASLAAPYWQLFEGGGALFLAAMGVGCLFYITRINRFVVTGNELILENILGQHRETVELKQITGWTETIRRNKGNEYYTLTLYAPRHQVSISSYLCGNYQQLKDVLTNGVAHDTAMQKLKERKRTVIIARIFIAAGLLVAGIAFSAYSDTFSPPVQLVSFTATQVNAPEVRKGSKGARWINIITAEYPQFNFRIANKRYGRMDVQAYLAYVQPGDVLQVEVDKDVYDMKLAKTKEAGFWMKHNSYSNITVFGLRDGEHMYLSASSYADNENALPLALVVAGIALVFTGAGAYMLLKRT